MEKTNTIFSRVNPLDKYVIRDKETKKVVFKGGKKLQFRSVSACQNYFNKLDVFEKEELEIFDNYPSIQRYNRK